MCIRDRLSPLLFYYFIIVLIVWYCRRGRRFRSCLLYTSPSPRDGLLSRMPSSVLMIGQPPRSTLSSSSAASDVYKRQIIAVIVLLFYYCFNCLVLSARSPISVLSLIHISEPTRRTPISYAFFCFNDRATTEIYTILFVGSVRCV